MASLHEAIGGCSLKWILIVDMLIYITAVNVPTVSCFLAGNFGNSPEDKMPLTDYNR